MSSPDRLKDCYPFRYVIHSISENSLEQDHSHLFFGTVGYIRNGKKFLNKQSAGAEGHGVLTERREIHGALFSRGIQPVIPYRAAYHGLKFILIK